MPDFEAKTVRKNPRPGGKYVFSPKLSDYDKRQKIYWPLRVDPAHKPPPKVHHKMTAPKPRRTNNQPRHKGKKPARPHSSEVTPTQDEEDKQKQKKKPLQNSKEAEAPKIQKTRTQNRTNPKNARNKTQVGEKEGSSPNTKTTNKQQERVPYSLKTHIPTISNKYMYCEQQEIQQKKKLIIILRRGHFRKVPRKAKKIT